jgi:hypothetical protein
MMVPPAEGSGPSPGALTTVALTRDSRVVLDRYTAVLRHLLDTAELAQPPARVRPEPDTDGAGSYAAKQFAERLPGGGPA